VKSDTFLPPRAAALGICCNFKKLKVEDPPKVWANSVSLIKKERNNIMKRKAIPEGKDEAGKMKIPHENGGDSLTLKTTNIRELILLRI